MKRRVAANAAIRKVIAILERLRAEKEQRAYGLVLIIVYGFPAAFCTFLKCVNVSSS